MFVFDRAFVAVPCPRCCYETDVQFRSAQLEDVVYCACCKAQIQLVDDEATAHVSRRSAHNAIRDLQRQIEKLNRTLTIEF